MPKKQGSVQKHNGAYSWHTETNLKELPIAKLEQLEQQNNLHCIQIIT